MSWLAADQTELLRALARHGAAVVAAPETMLRFKEVAGRENNRAAPPQMRQDFLDSGAL